MAQWGKNDVASNSVLWATESVNLPANSANRDDLFGNTTADQYFDGVTIGQYGVDTTEMAALEAQGEAKPAHAGWVLKTEGSGGRAGRVQYETLVAMRTITGDASDDASFPEYFINISGQPAAASANSAADEQATFTVTAATQPSGGSLTYLWQYTTDAGNTETFATTAAVPGFSGQTGATLTADANTIVDGTLVRCVVSATGATSVTSDNAELTVTS